MVSLGFSNSIQQSKIRCTNYATSPQGQLREFSAPIDYISLRMPIFPILAWIIMLLSARVMVLNFRRTVADGSAVGLKVILPCFCLPVFCPSFFGSVACSCFVCWCQSLEVWWWVHRHRRPSFCSPSCSFLLQLYPLICCLGLQHEPGSSGFPIDVKGVRCVMLSHIYILQPVCLSAGLLYLLSTKPAVRYTGPAEIYIYICRGLSWTRRKKSQAEAIY